MYLLHFYPLRTHVHLFSIAFITSNLPSRIDGILELRTGDLGSVIVAVDCCYSLLPLVNSQAVRCLEVFLYCSETLSDTLFSFWAELKSPESNVSKVETFN